MVNAYVVCYRQCKKLTHLLLTADDGTSLATAFKNVSIDSDTGQIAEKLLDTLFNVVINMNPW